MAPLLSLAQLQTQLSQGIVAPLYAILGEEDLLRDSAVAEVKAAVLGAEGSEFNYDVFYGDEAEGAAIAACAREVAVFAARRLVIVKSTEKLPVRQAEALLPYLAEPSESATVLFVASKLDGRLKFTQALTKAAVVIDCAPPKESQLLPWLKQEAGRLGLTLTEDAAHLLKDVCGGALYAGRRELEKLASYVPPERPVTIDDVAALRGTEPGASVFDLAAAIGAQNRGRALGIVARNVEAGEAPLRILGSLAWQYRRLWKVKDSLRQGGREADAARTLRMDPYKVRGFLGRFSEGHLREALEAFARCDAQLKGGSQNKPAIVLDRLILTLCDRGAEDAPAPRRPPVRAERPALRTKRVSNVRTITNEPRPGHSRGA